MEVSFFSNIYNVYLRQKIIDTFSIFLCILRRFYYGPLNKSIIEIYHHNVRRTLGAGNSANIVSTS